MPYPLDEVFPAQLIQFIPKTLKTVEDVAMADYGDIPVKKSYEWVEACRRYLARTLAERIWREGEKIIVLAQEGADYPPGYAERLFKRVICGVCGIQPKNLEMVSQVGREFRYQTVGLSEWSKRDLEEFEEYAPEVTLPEVFAPPEEEVVVPTDLFDAIVGYEDVKSIMVRSLTSEKPVHIFLVGPPASAKTIFLLCIDDLPKARYVLGGSSTKAGLTDVLLTQGPRYLLIDELDKMCAEDYSVLLSLCETGRVSETKFGRTREAKLDTRVYAAANSTERIPREVLSRFQVFKFPAYTPPEYQEVVEKVLTKKEGVDSELAKHISQRVSTMFESTDVRDAIRIARLARNQEEVDRCLAVLAKYR